jgi:thioesterase domain-containing protein/acyl carrier protein
VIYTSGSTGKPKGAINLHRGVSNLLRWDQQTMELDATDRILFKTPLSFDVSVQEFFRGLISGGRVVIAKPGGQREPEYLVDLMICEGVTTADFVPALLRLILEEERIGQCRALKRVASVGDTLPNDVRELFFRRSSATFYNAYGPTETSVVVTRWKCRPDYEFDTIPIGRPAFNVRLYVLDEERNPVPVGAAGELYIAGAAVGRGYLNRAELTAERFLPDPFSEAAGDRMYRTGDCCRYLPDGNVEFLGRLDYQVKIRGFRIEPAEIEAALDLLPGLRQSVVVAREDVSGAKCLAAFYVAADLRAPPAVEEIRELLKQQLPEYMIPSSFSMLERLPLTTQGKVDRRTLQTMPLAATERKRRFVPPADSSQLLIAQVWEELLGVKPIGIRDNFFELGGHSLLAISMLDRIERLFGRKIPVAALFAEPTIQTLSLALWNAERNEAVSPLVEVQRGADRRPFFFLHGDFNGGGFYCHNLARHLGADQPFYAIHPHGMAGPQIPATIEAMAEEYLELVRARQPEGPYLLGGHCNGALVAFEMARCLHAAGQKVDLLVMLAPPRRPRVCFSSVMNVGLRQLMRVLFPVSASRFLERRVPNLRRIALLWVYAAACRTYFPRRYSGPAAVLPAEKDIREAADPSLGWKDVASDVAVHVIPGWHSTGISKHADVVAAIIAAGLQAAQRVECNPEQNAETRWATVSSGVAPPLRELLPSAES